MSLAIIDRHMYLFGLLCQAAFLLYEMAWKLSKDTNDLLWFVHCSCFEI